VKDEDNKPDHVLIKISTSSTFGKLT
jgi:hypothetical protein